jgi:uncharacterized protein (DUF2344 family)
MYRLVVKNEQIVIIDRLLSKEECEFTKEFGAQWIVEAFRKYINIDISDYMLHEHKSETNCFILHIRKEDLAKLREDKLSKLFE